MPELFQVKIMTGEVLKGWHWPVSDPMANLVIMTGMDEYAKRYEPFALWMNEQGIDVRCLDAFGQGENAESEELQEIWPEDGFAKNVDAIKAAADQASSNGKPVFIMGHSMGSFMVQSLIERYPCCAEGVILCGSNGGEYVKMRGASILTSLRIREADRRKPAPEFDRFGLGGYAAAIENRRTDFDWLSYNTENVDDYIADPWCGHSNTGSFWVEFTKGMSTIWHPRMLNRISPEENILIIAGADDPVGRMGEGPRWLEKMYTRLGVKKVRMYIYAHMRHEILREDAKVTVFLDILNFIETSCGV